MTKTKLKNGTEVEITLKEGTAGILRTICDLQPGHHYHVTSELNQTYKEYWCIGNGSDQFTLSSDDLVEWKEIVIKPTSDPIKFHWEGIPWKKQGTPQAPFSFLSKLGNKVLMWMNGPKPSGPTDPATTTTDPATITTDPATTTTTIKTPESSAKDTSTCVAPTEGAPPAAASTTVTNTSTPPPSTATTATATTPTATTPNISIA